MSIKFTHHDKRVTLHLAMLSSCCREIGNLGESLDLLPSVDWDLDKLPQSAQEVIFAEFDEYLEEKIKAEFVADPSFLVDYGSADNHCKLCGHEHTRYEFKIDNTVNGSSVLCGSKCILTHGISVKGAETAEHARKALERTLRLHLKKLKIEAWHKESGFEASDLYALKQSLRSIAKNWDNPYHIRNKARCMYRYDLPKLDKFYSKNGWLNTEKRWDEWRRLVSFARDLGDFAKTYPTHEACNPKKVVKKEEPIVAESTTPAKEDAPVVAVEETVKAAPLDYNSMVKEMVFG